MMRIEEVSTVDLNSTSLIHPRDAVVNILSRIYHRGMTTASGGNVSVLDENDNVWISPARLDKGKLRHQDVVCLQIDGTIDEGQRSPSSELPFHKAIYKARPDVRVVVHAHPNALVTFSIVAQVPDTRIMHHVRRVCGEVAFSPFRMPGTDALGEEIASAFAQGANCVILENHGVVVGGPTPGVAFERFETLEFISRILLRAKVLGIAKPLSTEQLAIPKYEFDFVPQYNHKHPSNHERELRRGICEFMKRGYERHMFVTTGDTLSARIDQEAFLITPALIDRRDLTLDDIVLIRNGATHQDGRKPNAAVKCHQAIYEAHPEISAIANAYPVNLSAFSVTNVTIATESIPESFVVLRDVQRASFELQYERPEELARLISPVKPIAILENDGALITGSGLLDVFDRLEVLESTAQTLIDGQTLGTVKLMSEDVVNQLRGAFPTAYNALSAD